MSCSKVIQAILGLSTIVALTGCTGSNGEPLGAASGPPDLVPIPTIISFDPFSHTFCHRDSDGNLLVTVRDQGGPGAGPTITRVAFGDFGFQEHNLLVPVSGVTFSQPILGTSGSDISFTITVDAAGQVDEAHEDDNIVTGLGLG